MADVWARVADLDEVTQQGLAQVLETRGADAQQRSMRDVFLANILPSTPGCWRSAVERECSPECWHNVRT